MKVSTHEATSPGAQVPSCEPPIFIKKNVVAETKIRSLRLVPQTMLGSFVNCSRGKSLRPNENILTDLLLFCKLAWRINLVFVCIGGLVRVVAVFRFCINNIGHRRKKKLYRNCK